MIEVGTRVTYNEGEKEGVVVYDPLSQMEGTVSLDCGDASVLVAVMATNVKILEKIQMEVSEKCRGCIFYLFAKCHRYCSSRYWAMKVERGNRDKLWIPNKAYPQCQEVNPLSCPSGLRKPWSSIMGS